MAYSTLTVIVDGTLDEEEDFTDETLERERITELATEAYNEGLTMDLYRIYHDHAPDIECVCVQYLTDHHHPIYSFPADLVHFEVTA